MDNLSKEEVYRQLNDELAARSIQEGEIYLREYARDRGLTIDSARSFIESLQRDGKAVMRIVSYPRKAVVFKLVQQPIQEHPKRKGKAIKTF